MQKAAKIILHMLLAIMLALGATGIRPGALAEAWPERSGGGRNRMRVSDAGNQMVQPGTESALSGEGENANALASENQPVVDEDLTGGSQSPAPDMEEPPAGEEWQEPLYDLVNPAAVDTLEFFSYNMSQFVPNKDYGLFVLNGGNRPVSLDGRTFTPGENFVLSAIFYVNAPVQPGRTYTYRLPEALSGNAGAVPSSLVQNGERIAYLNASGGQVEVVFTGYAADCLRAGQSFVLRYDFIQTLDESLAGKPGPLTIQIPAGSSHHVASIIIEGGQGSAPSDLDALSGWDDLSQPEEQPGGDDIPAGEENFILYGDYGVDEEPANVEEPANDEEPGWDEAPDGDEAPPLREVRVERLMEDIMLKGYCFIMEATLVGLDEEDCLFQWQYNAGEGWVDAAGANSLILGVIADEDNVNYGWRILVTPQRSGTDE